MPVFTAGSREVIEKLIAMVMKPIGNKRLLFIDYGKALGILFVLLIHSGVDSLNEYVLFAMPLFFIASGYTLRIKERDLKEFAKVRFKKLMLPFWILFLLYIPLEIVRAYYYGYGTYREALPALINMIYGSGAKVPDLFGIRESVVSAVPYSQPSERFMYIIYTPNCHLWFLPAMFTASIIAFVILKKFRERKIVLAAMSFILTLIAAAESLPNVVQFPYGIGRGCIGAAFMIVGYKLKERSFFENRTISHKTVAFAASSAVALFFIKVLGIYGEGMVRSSYGSYGIWSAFLTFVGGTAAVIAVLSFFNLLEEVKIGYIGKVLSEIGQNSMEIYLWQFFGFFALEVLYFTISGESPFPDKYWMGVLPPAGAWFKPVEVVLVIAATILIKKRIILRDVSESGSR